MLSSLQRISTLILVIFALQPSLAQQSKRDSLLQVISSGKPQARIESLTQLGILTAKSNLDSGSQYLKIAYRLSWSECDSANIVRTGRLTAEVLRRHQRLDSDQLW